MAHKHHRSPLFEIARVLVCVDHVARFIENPNDGVMLPAEEFGITDCVRLPQLIAER
jgi:hypothetical protein